MSPHGHVDPVLLAEDRPYPDPAALFISGDHYVTRLLHAAGADLAVLGVGQSGPAPDPRAAWRIFCEGWHLLAGTATRAWLEAELVELFDVHERPEAANADRLYDHIAGQLDDAAHRPRALYHRMGIEVLATTDDPASDLAAHAALEADPTWTGRIVPTWRPDRYVRVRRRGWTDALAELGTAADVDTSTYDGYLDALRRRRDHFRAKGATASDHGHLDPGSARLAPEDAAAIFKRACAGDASEGDATAFRRHMVGEMARMARDDGLVMALHTGVARDHHPPSAARFGPDTGHDIPVANEFTRHLQPLLSDVGDDARFRLVLFTVDESTFSRELAPLAGFYPSVYLGAPWWFLDAPDALARFRAAVTETAGFSRSAGFVDDTRALCSVRARHDVARRVDCGYLARLVAEHRLAEDEAARIATDLAGEAGRRVFRL